MADPITDGINEQLDLENQRLRQQVDVLQTMVRRNDNQLDEIVKYLPQLTHLATNVSQVASAQQQTTAALYTMNTTLLRIAEALEKEK